MVHFNDVLEVTASILIKSSGGNLSDYLSSGELEKCSSTGVYSVLAPYSFIIRISLLHLQHNSTL